jgi:hypothetical protein
MKSYRAISVLGFVAFIFTSTTHANENISENSIQCVAIKIKKLSQLETGQKQLGSLNALSLGEECGKEHNWTSRKATAASFYTVSNGLLQKSKENWSATGFSEDLPIRIQKRMTIGQFNELALQGKSDTFQEILAEELAATGSKLNADDTIDTLSLADSNVIGQKLGNLLMGIFLRNEFQKFYDDPTYDSPDLFALFIAINPDSAELLARLK